jgi:hypothetical protein
MATDTERRIARGERDRLEPPKWFAKIVEALTPSTGHPEGPDYVLSRVWARHP